MTIFVRRSLLIVVLLFLASIGTASAMDEGGGQVRSARRSESGLPSEGSIQTANRDEGAGGGRAPRRTRWAWPCRLLPDWSTMSAAAARGFMNHDSRGRRGVPGAHPVAKRSVQRVYFFGGEILRSFITLTTPSVSFASRSASPLACSFGTVPFR